MTLPRQETFQNRSTGAAPARPRHHHKDRQPARPSRDFVPLRDRLSQIQAIPRASGQISIGYPITSHLRTIQGDFSPNSSRGSNGISRRRHQGSSRHTDCRCPAIQRGVLNATDQILEKPARKHRPSARNSPHSLDGRRRRGRRLQRASAARTALQNALDSTALMLSKNRGVANERRATDRGDQHLQCPVYSDQRQESHGHRELFHDQRIATRAHRQRDRQHEFYEHHWHRLDQYRRLVDIDLGQYPAARRARARQYRFDGEFQQDDRAEDGVAESSHATPERGGDGRRRLRFDRPVQQGRQRRYQQRELRRGCAGICGKR